MKNKWADIFDRINNKSETHSPKIPEKIDNSYFQ
jgi:hypothetical protein